VPATDIEDRNLPINLSVRKGVLWATCPKGNIDPPGRTRAEAGGQHALFFDGGYLIQYGSPTFKNEYGNDRSDHPRDGLITDANGRATAAPPISEMNSRRLMGRPHSPRSTI
jgi:hypothetical protein